MKWKGLYREALKGGVLGAPGRGESWCLKEGAVREGRQGQEWQGWGRSRGVPDCSVNSGGAVFQSGIAWIYLTLSKKGRIFFFFFSVHKSFICVHKNWLGLKSFL